MGGLRDARLRGSVARLADQDRKAPEGRHGQHGQHAGAYQGGGVVGEHHAAGQPDLRERNDLAEGRGLPSASLSM
jgi:hypothetical protein